jgi:MFS family permease
MAPPYVDYARYRRRVRPVNSDDRPVVGFTMVAHALFHAYELSIPVFVVVWLETFTASEALLGLVVGVGYAAIGLGAVPSGVLSDEYGSDRIVFVALLGMAVGFGLMSLAPNVVVLALALGVWGTAASLYHPAGLSLLSRRVDQRGTAFAYHGAAGNVGTVVGPLITSVLLVFLPWRSVAALFVVPALAGVAVAARLPLGELTANNTDSEPPSLAGVRRDTRALFAGGFLVIFGAVLCYGLYYRGVLTFLPEILSGLPTLDPVTAFGRTVSPGQYVYAALLTVGVGGQYAGGYLTDVVESKHALVTAFGLLIVGALAFVPAATAGVVPLLVVCLLLGFAIYVTAPVYQATIAESVTDDSHGLSYGYTYLGMFGVGALGAPLAGAALSYATTTALFVGLAGVATLGGVTSVYLIVRRRREATAGEDRPQTEN